MNGYHAKSNSPFQIRIHRILFLFFLFSGIFLLVIACSKTGEMKSIAGKPNTLAIFKEQEGFYWVVPGIGIEKIENDHVWLKEDVLVTYGKGEGNIEQIVRTLVEHRQTQGGGYQATGSTITETSGKDTIVTKLYDCFTGITTKKLDLTVVEVIEIKTGEYRRSDK